jgi:hypothetical protein
VLGGFVSLGLVKGIPRLLRELEVDPQPLLAEAGLSEKLLEGENNRISLRALGTLLLISAEEAGCPHFGLLLGSKISLAHLGAFASPLQSCDTLGAALRLVETRLGWDRGALSSEMWDDVSYLRREVDTLTEAGDDHRASRGSGVSLNDIRSRRLAAARTPARGTQPRNP